MDKEDKQLLVFAGIAFAVGLLGHITGYYLMNYIQQKQKADKMALLQAQMSELEKTGKGISPTQRRQKIVPKA